MKTRPGSRERRKPTVASRHDYLSSNLVAGLILQVFTAAPIAGLAISRASQHRLSGVALAGILIGDAALNGIFRATLNYFLGAAETAEGRVIADASIEPAADRPFWTRCLIWSACSGLWGAAIGLIALAALNHRTAGFPVVFAGLLIAGGGSAVPLSLLARSEGVRASLGPSGEPRPLRRRAWREIALPLGLLIGATNAGFGWLLFHDYTPHVAFAAKTLTKTEAFADATLLVVISALLAALTAGAAGRAEGRTGRILLENPATEVPAAKSPYGRQIYLYSILATLLVTGTVVDIVTPDLPSLWQVMLARAILAGSAAVIVGGFAFVRGATNALVVPVAVSIPSIPEVAA